MLEETSVEEIYVLRNLDLGFGFKLLGRETRRMKWRGVKNTI